MPVTVTPVGGFIPQTNIKIIETTANTILSNIKIEKKEFGKNYVTIVQTDSDGATFNYTDINEFGKSYVYRVSYDIYQRQTISNTTSNRRNYWFENWTLGSGLAVDSAGTLYGTGTATAKDAYLSKLNTSGQQNVNLTAWIGNGGDSKGKPHMTSANIIFYLRSGTTTTVERELYLAKVWSNSAYYSRRFWYWLYRKDIDGKRTQLKLIKDTADGIDLELYFKRKGNTYTYGFSSNMAALTTFYGLSSKGGRCTRLRVALKNGAKLRPDFNVTVNKPPTYKYVLLKSISQEVEIVIRDEPDIDYGIIMNENGEGFRFSRYGGSRLLDSEDYETQSVSQMLDIQDSEYPIVYVNDNKKTPKTNIIIYTDNLPFRNRMRNRIIKSNYIYIYTPKKWNYQLMSGFYAYETVSEQRIRNSSDMYYFKFNGARRVQSTLELPPAWTYDRLRSVENSYIDMMDNYRDYGDLAVSPAGTEVLGQKAGDD